MITKSTVNGSWIRAGSAKHNTEKKTFSIPCSTRLKYGRGCPIQDPIKYSHPVPISAQVRHAQSVSDHPCRQPAAARRSHCDDVCPRRRDHHRSEDPICTGGTCSGRGRCPSGGGRDRHKQKQQKTKTQQRHIYKVPTQRLR